MEYKYTVKRPDWLWIALITVVSVLLHRPDLVLTDVPVNGADSVGHIWGAELFFQNWQTGTIPFWSTSWYSGTPFFQYYMIPPFFVMSLLATGNAILGGAIVLAGFALTLHAKIKKLPLRLRWFTIIVLGVLVGISMPLNVAFKIVLISGFVFQPLAVWYAAKPYKINSNWTALMSLIFTYSTAFFIQGGNAMSALVGEFSYNIGFTLAIFCFGIISNKHSKPLAILLGGLVALTHVIAFIFLVGLISIKLIHSVENRKDRLWLLAGLFGVMSAVLSAGLANVLASLVLVGGSLYKARASASTLILPHLKFFVPTIVLSSWWLIPFVATRDSITNPNLGKIWGPDALLGIFWVLAPAGIIIALFNLWKYKKSELSEFESVWTFSTVLFLGLFYTTPAEVFWNGRIIPFVYFSIIMLIAASCYKLLAEMRAEEMDITEASIGRMVKMVSLAILAVVAIGVYDTVFIASAYFDGFAGSDEEEEFFEITAMVQDLAETSGCGTIQTEMLGEDDDFGRYGSPLALIYLPHYTDGCIGTGIGLYTESSATALFQRSNHHTVSSDPRLVSISEDTPAADLDLGLQQMRQLGNRWYMAHSDEMKAQADVLVEKQQLTFVDQTSVWSLYEVVGHNLAETIDPTAIEFSELSYEEWREKQLEEFSNSSDGTVSAQGEAPSSIASFTTEEGDIKTAVNDGEVTVLGAGNLPVIIKQSYHPYWSAEGADGPYPVGPNMMLVYPESENFTLTWVQPDWVQPLRWIAMILSSVLLYAYVFDTRSMFSKKEDSNS